MNDQSPFDRRGDGSSRDGSARNIFIGMGVIGIILIILVLPPISLLSGHSKKSNTGGASQNNGIGAAKNTKNPDGYEILSKVEPLSKPKGTNGPYALTVKLTQTVTDGRNLALYTNQSGRWNRLASATLIANGTAVSGQVADMPPNVAVLRRTSTAIQMYGSLPGGTQPDSVALDVLSVVDPVDYKPSPDGTLQGSPNALPSAKGNVAPTIRAIEQGDIDAVNTILQSPQLRDAHVAALVQLSLQTGYSGIDIDYERVNPARKADFSAFIGSLSDKLHQSSKTLTISLPAPVKTGVSWDTGAYDWDELSKRVDMIKMVPDPDPSTYYKRMDDTLGFLKGKIDLKKVALTVTRNSYEKGTDGLRSLPLREALTLASTIEVRTSAAVTPNSAVVIVGKNIFQDDGASGLHWDDTAEAVSFSYPGRGGQRTVWMENGLSIGFKLDLARRYGLGGIALDDVSSDPFTIQLWEPLRTYAESGNVGLTQPNSILLRPVWQVQAGNSEVGNKGNIVWRAPAQPGSYDVSLVISDGVIRASQKIVMEVKAPSGTPTSGSSATPSPRPSVSGTPGTPGPTATRPTSGATVAPVASNTPRPPVTPVPTQKN